MFNRIITENMDEETVLWKYMDLSKFLSLLSQKSLWLARADTFKEQHEGKFHLEMEQTLNQFYAKHKKENQL